MSTPSSSGNIPPPVSPRESQRLAALRALEIIDTPREAAFDDIASLVAEICQTPIALITLIDESRQWFKAAVGMPVRETTRETAFCTHALDEHDVMVVPDATQDPRFAANPYVTGDPHIRFYAGAPLVTPEGYALGTLCVIDRVPRQLDDRQLAALRILGRQVMTEMQLRRRLLEFGRVAQALRQSEREQRALVQSLEAQRARLVEAQNLAKMGSWETDLSTLAVHWSEQTHRIFETNPDTFVPTHAGFLERVHPEDRAAVDRAFQLSAGSGEIQSIEHRVLLPDGRIKFVEERWQVYFAATGQPARATGTCRDITERRIAEEERDRLFNLSLDLLCVAGFDGRLRQVNPAWTDCLGWTAAELTSRPMLDFIHPDDRAATLESRAKIHQGESSRGFENRYRCKDGSYRWLSWSVHPLADVQQVFGVAHDVTARRRTEEALHRGQNLSRMAGRLARIGAWSVDLKANSVFWSDEVCAIHGMPRGHRPTVEEGINFYAPEFRALITEKFGACAREGRAFDLEMQIITAAGQRVWVRGIGEAERNAAGEIVGVRGAFQDITERRQAEEERQQTNRLIRIGGRIARVGGWALEAADNRVTWSDEVCEILEYPPGVVPPLQEALAHYPPGAREQISAALTACLQDGTPFDVEIEIDTARHRRLHVRVVGEAERGTDGAIRRVLGAFQDITHLKLAQDKLRREESLMALAGKISKVAGWTLTVPDRKLYWSRQVWEMVDYPPGRLPEPDDLLSYYLPDSRKKLSLGIARCARAGEPFDLELQLTTPTGRAMWVRVAGEADRDDQGRIRAVHGAFSDITTRKQGEEELQRLARRLSNTLESITDAFFTLDPHWRFTYLNTEAERLLMRPGVVLVGRHIWTEFPDAVGSLFQREYERAVAEKVTVGFEAYYPAPLDRWFGVRAYPSEEGLGVYFQDITAARRAREDLRLSEERFRELAENIGDVFFNFDPVNNRLLYGSPAYEKIWGRPLAEVYANPMSYLDAIDPAERPAAEAAFARQLEGEETTADFRVIRPDGSARWVREHAVPVRDRQGRVERIVGTMRDITESRQASEELRKSEEQYRLLFTSNPHPMWVFDLETLRILAVNAAAVSHYGYSEAEFLAMRDIDLRAPEDAITFENAIAWLPPPGKATGLRRHRKKDGTVIEIDATSDSVTLAGRPARMTLAHDVTERRRTEAKLREQAALLDKAQDAILVRDLSHHITYWNKSAERLYGWTAAEALGRNARELLYFDRTIFDAALVHLLAQGEWTGELVQLRKDGAVLTIEGRWTLVRDEAGRPRAVLAINTDITERKKLEAQFLRAQRMESIGTLAGGIAHDLNNLLAPITMGVDLLRLFDPPTQSLPVIENIERSAKRGAELVKQVLSFARGVEGARVTVQVRHIVAEVEAIAGNTFPKNITLDSRLPRDLWPVLADATQLNQVVMNLCVNARDAMPNGGRLELSASNIEIDAQYAAMNQGGAPGRYVVIQVTDTGIGMPKEIIDRIFEPFFTTKELGKGTGLGLSTVLGIVRSHGGFVQVDSEVGRGSTFKVYLPAHDAHDPAVGNHHALAPLPHGQGELILVVDDEIAILEITKQTLLAFGYRVVTAEDGAQAIGLYAQHRDEIALVLTDMMMPVMDGATLILALRRINPRVRVIATSGLKGNRDLAPAGDLGVKHFVPKPFSADLLLRFVRQVLHEGGSRPPL